MGLIRNLIWEVGMAVLFGGIVLFAIYKLGVASGTGTPAENWSTLAAAEFTGNVSLIGLVIVIGLIAGVLSFTKFIKK